MFTTEPHDIERQATIDHKKPKSQGGTEEDDNLVTCCLRCNQEKGDIPYGVYRWYLHMKSRGYHHAELKCLLSIIATTAEPGDTRNTGDNTGDTPPE